MKTIKLADGTDLTLSDGKYEEFKKQFSTPENVRWRAGRKEEYWFVDEEGDAWDCIETDSTKDEWRYNTGNYFKSESEAEHHKQVLLATQKIKDYALQFGYTPDWSNVDEFKYEVIYYHDIKKLNVYIRTSSQFSTLPYYRTSDDAYKAIKELEAEYKLVFGVE